MIMKDGKRGEASEFPRHGKFAAGHRALDEDEPYAHTIALPVRRPRQVARRKTASLYQSRLATLQSTRNADVAQLVEQPIRNRQVTGSSPVVGSRQGGTNFGSFWVSYLFFLFYLSFVACTALRDSP